MNWTLLSVVVGIFVHFLIAVWYYGRMAERVENQGGWLRTLDSRVEDHGKRLSRVEGRLGIASNDV